MSDNLPEGYWYRLDKVYYAPDRSSLVVRAGGKSMYVMLGKRQERTIREYLATWFKEEGSDE